MAFSESLCASAGAFSQSGLGSMDNTSRHSWEPIVAFNKTQT